MSIQLKPFSWERMIDAVEAVRRRMLKAAAALHDADLPCAVIGDNAVAAWVSRVDRADVRNTQDVDILIRRSDFNAVQSALENAGFVYRSIFKVDCFLDAIASHPRDAVHIVLANEKVKPNDLAPTAGVTERETGEGYEVIQLESLVRMKLTSFRRKDQAASAGHDRRRSDQRNLATTFPARACRTFTAITRRPRLLAPLLPRRSATWRTKSNRLSF